MAMRTAMIITTTMSSMSVNPSSPLQAACGWSWSSFENLLVVSLARDAECGPICGYRPRRPGCLSGFRGRGRTSMRRSPGVRAGRRAAAERGRRLVLDQAGDVEHRQVQADQDAADRHAHDDDQQGLDQARSGRSRCRPPPGRRSRPPCPAWRRGHRSPRRPPSCGSPSAGTPRGAPAARPATRPASPTPERRAPRRSPARCRRLTETMSSACSTGTPVRLSTDSVRANRLIATFCTSFPNTGASQLEPVP